MQKTITLVQQFFEGYQQIHPEFQAFQLTPETILIGANGLLDSLGIVNFTLGLEEYIKEKTQKEVCVFTDELLMNSHLSPVTLEQLYVHIHSQLEGAVV